MPDELALVRGWFLKAESDLNAARRVVESDGPYDTVCFHAQQAVEKYLKGLLAFRGQPFPPTHNLEQLQHLGEALPAWPRKCASACSASFLRRLTLNRPQRKMDYALSN